MNPENLITSYSLALYSNWYYYKPARCLFDAGEGVATLLGKKIFGIRNIFLTHGHEDHIAGLSNLINVRNIVSGETDKPLTIYYPKHDQLINHLFEYIEKKQRGLIRYPLYVQPLEVGDSVDLEGMKRPSRVFAFETQHARGQLSLGYEIRQERKVLEEHTGKSVYKLHTIFLYGGDGYRVYTSPLGRADIAIHEATFYERDAGNTTIIDHRHSTIEHAVEWGASEDVKNLILCHISDRYTLEEAYEVARAAREKSGFRGGLFIAYRERIVSVDDA